MMTRGYWFLIALAIIGALMYAGSYTGHLYGFKTNAERARMLPGAPNSAGYWKSFKKPHDTVLRERLTPLQYDVTQEDGTEAPFHNEYWETKEEGIYVDIVSGEPLFSSTDKYDSGTGWPSFTKPIDPSVVTTESDTRLGIVRTEVRSKIADSHLGHIFDDGPAPAGLRYCINSAALRFVAKDRLQAEGYGEYLKLFE